MRGNTFNEPGQQMRDDFSNWLGQRCDVIFPMGQEGPTHDRCFFEWAGIAKLEMSFLAARPDYKRRKKNNIESQSLSTKQNKKSFETS